MGISDENLKFRNNDLIILIYLLVYDLMINNKWYNNNYKIIKAE